MNYRRSIIVAELWRPGVARWWKKLIFNFLTFFWKNDPEREIFKKILSRNFHRDTDRRDTDRRIRRSVSRHNILCSSLVKFGRREIGTVARYLPDKKKQNFAWLSSSCHCADRTQNLPGPAPDNVPRMLYFRRSYTRTREYYQSVSNIRLKHSFESNEN